MRLVKRMLLSLAILFLSATNLQALCWDDIRYYIGTHHAWVGPELNYMKRYKPALGSEQSGLLYGFRGAIERDEPNALYWGVEGAYVHGVQNGYGSLRRTKVRADAMDSEVEGRFGYSFVGNFCVNFAITPFIGVGYSRTRNNYKPPTPISVHYTDYYAFGAAGFLSQFWCEGPYSVGLNVKVRQMYEGRSLIENHPLDSDAVVQVEDKPQWIFELPLSWYTVACDRWVDVCLTPFYQYRHIGFRESYPVPFPETRLDCFGARLTFGTYF